MIDSPTFGVAADSHIGARDIIHDFGAGAADSVDLSAFGLTATNLFQSKGPATATDSTNFFVISGTTYQIVSTQFGSNTYVYVDLNHNGNFETASDLAIKLLGLPSLSSRGFALTAAPAGITGEPINLALTAPDNAPDGSLVTVSIANVPSGWSLSGGTLLPDGTWTVQTERPSIFDDHVCCGIYGGYASRCDRELDAAGRQHGHHDRVRQCRSLSDRLADLRMVRRRYADRFDGRRSVRVRPADRK